MTRIAPQPAAARERAVGRRDVIWPSRDRPARPVPPRGVIRPERFAGGAHRPVAGGVWWPAADYLVFEPLTTSRCAGQPAGAVAPRSDYGRPRRLPDLFRCRLPGAWLAGAAYPSVHRDRQVRNGQRARSPRWPAPPLTAAQADEYAGAGGHRAPLAQALWAGAAEAAAVEAGIKATTIHKLRAGGSPGALALGQPCPTAKRPPPCRC